MVQGGNEVGKEEGDLKRSREGFKMSALDRTQAKPCTVCDARRCTASVCDVGLCARTHVSEFKRKPVYAIKHMCYARSQGAETKN
jgi:hypothetical protein